MNEIALKAETRTTKGNSPARALRRGGRLPAILYGRNTVPDMLSINAHDLELILKTGGLGRSIMNLSIDGGQKSKPVMIKELQVHPVSKQYLHVDLYEVAMDRPIRVNVPV
ncbi:MAG: 50S ribosomal protein L25, partial [Desulfatitalea sp.]|nr:50S ribosomal protein L25 [Desulfatitalea sp.]NNJ99574.1 50S ribosomal protein L25 [Desulfatitalea sp.]